MVGDGTVEGVQEYRTNADKGEFDQLPGVCGVDLEVARRPKNEWRYIERWVSQNIISLVYP